MMLYTNGTNLFLQNVTEHRHLGGLFAVTAEWLRPVGSIELPQSIPTSLGEVDVFPEPSIATGTDGFERITATGYDIWDQTTYEVRKFTTGEITAKVLTYINPTTSPDTGETYYTTDVKEITFPGYIFEVAHLKKVRRKGTPTLPPAPTLKVRNSGYAEITQFSLPSNYVTFVGITSPVEKTIQITNINVNDYGAVEEVEVVYSIINATANFNASPP